MTDEAGELRAMVDDPITAEVISCTVRGGVVRTVLRLSRLPSQPIAPASLRLLAQGQEKVLDLHRSVEATEERFTFETYSAGTAPLQPGETYAFSSWWAAWQLELVADVSKPWARRRFGPSDGVLVRGDGAARMRRRTDTRPENEGELVPGGWDHEHCRLCWVKIWQGKPGVEEGYTDGRDWLCPACYEEFVASGLGPKLG